MDANVAANVCIQKKNVKIFSIFIKIILEWRV